MAVRHRDSEDVDALRMRLQAMEAVNSSARMEEAFGAVVSVMRAFVKFDRATVLLLNEKGDAFDVYAVHLESDGVVSRTPIVLVEAPLPYDGTVSGWVLRNQASRRLDDLKAEQHLFPATRAYRQDGMRSGFIAPLWVNARLVGALNVWGHEVSMFDARACDLIEIIADSVASAVHNAALLQRETQLVEQLRETSRIKDELLAMVSHDLRSPLTALYGYVRMMRSGRLGEVPAALLEIFESFERACSFMQGLLDDLSDVARMGIRGIDLCRETVDLRTAVDDVLRALQAQADERRVTLAVDAPSGSLAVDADPKRLRQILTNLVSNAIKYNRRDGSVRVCVTLDDAGTARIEVADTGSGIPPEEHDTIFDLYHRLSSHKSLEGSGVGLAITRELVTLHGGRIWIDSEVGQGSRFFFTLPRAQPSMPAPDVAALTREPGD